MTVTTAPPPTRPPAPEAAPLRLTNGHLPKWAPWAILGGSVVLSLIVFAVARDGRRRRHQHRRARRRRRAALPRADPRHLQRRRGPPQGRRPPRHGRRRRGLPPRDGPAGLGRVDRRRQRRRGPVRRVPHQLDAQRRRRGRRRAPRDRRHAADHPRRRDHLDPDRAVHGDLPRRVRPGPQARARHHVPRRRHDRHPVDRRRSVRLRRCSRSSSAPASAWASWARSRWPC